MSFCSLLVKNWGQFFEKLRFFLICHQKQRKQIDSIFRMLSTCRDSFDVHFETFLTFTWCQTACREHWHWNFMSLGINRMTQMLTQQNMFYFIWIGVSWLRLTESLNETSIQINKAQIPSIESKKSIFFLMSMKTNVLFPSLEP